MKELGFDALFTFIYSPRPGTRAAEMPDPATKADKNRRFDKLVDTQNRISAEIHQKYTRTDGFEGLLPDQLSVPVPYDRVYWTYLVAMIDFVRGSIENYEHSLAAFREAYGEYARAVQRASGCRRKRSLT